MKTNILPLKILEKTVKELFYTAGMNVMQIAEVLNLKTSEVKEHLNTNEIYPPVKLNNELANVILYDANLPVARETIINTEKSRFEKYAEIEQKSLSIMSKLLDFYEKEPIGVDLSEDRFKANLAIEFIKATQQCREELLKKYEIDKKQSDNDNCIKIEFI